MTNFQNIEDEPFPSFLSNASLGSSGRNTLGNVTLGSTLGMPMAASTVAKIRPPVDNRWVTPACNLMNIVIATVLPVMMEEEEGSTSEGTDSERCSGSITSFLANEKLMSLDSMNSDMTDDDIDVNQLQDEELELYFNKLMPPAMQRGRVEGQEIPVVKRNRHHDDYDLRDFHMPDVRLAATGMDSCPASDEEDTEDELEAAQNRGRARFLLPSTSRQPVGESHRPHFRPGLEGGSSDDELQMGGRNPDTRTGIEHRRSAEGQVINSPITGKGMGDRVGPVGTGEAGHATVASGPASRCPVNWSMSLDRQEALKLLNISLGANAAHSVVYQNEEGKWVTDLAYYSSFEKEMEANMPEEVAMQFQSEDFLAGSQAMDKIIEDQEEFEKEHQFMQEEQIQAVNMSEVLGDTSWKVPSGSNILMRASQVSSEFEPGNQSYLRISLGEFFQRRSEALGCLGSSEEDNVKRPSFGYFITSPEKRKPVALLRPSDMFSRGSSINNETVPQSDADETLNPGAYDILVSYLIIIFFLQMSAQYGDKESSGHSESPNSSSNLLLSISTIASAIADASISSDPAQLAAMIMELSKRSRSKSRQQVTEESIMSSVSVAASNQNGLLEDLQKTTSVGDLSTPDMEKYLKRAEVSGSDSDGSTSQSCLDILTLADSLASSNKLTRQQLAGKAQRSPAGDPGSPQSHCSSPSLSRLTYLSINENTCMPTPDHHHKVRNLLKGKKKCFSSVQVMVPNELKFPSSCCVGIASQTSLNIFNPSERWQQVSISITSLSIDGEKSIPFQWLIVKNKTIIGPKCTEEQRVLFIAPRAGLYQYTLSVSSWPASAESETVVHAEVFAKKVVLIAVAENPVIEVDVGKTGCLDFGDMPGGSTKALLLKLVNRTHATVPIRLVISANASAWHCFSFSKSPVAMTTDGSLHTGSSLTSLSTSSVINHVLHASYNQESFLVWVHFSAPQKYISSSGELGPADEYSARVDIEVDSPGPSHVIQSVALRARSGTPRVHAPKDLQTVCLQAPLGQTAKQTLPLKNAGNIDVLLRLKITDGDSCFTVRPEELTLKAGEEQGVVVSFTAQDKQKLRESMLTILVLPSGPQYEVMLKGEMIQGVSGRVVSAALSQAEVPPILSNKQFMAWGGVTLGRAVQQKLVLRNNSPTTSQQLRLLIRGQDQDGFQLQSSFGPDERLTRNRELSIKPKEDVTVHLLFAPTRVASMLAKLEIKQSAARASQPGVKFTIPLSGYGGTSNVILEELRKRSEGYVATLSGVQAGRVSKLCVCVRNTGSRAAFVKAVPYSSLQNRAVMDSTVISLSPSQFVLKERTQEVITIAMKASRREQALCQSGAALLATVCLFCGDEVSRQQFRKLLQIKPEAGNKVLSENSLLKSIPFDEMFLGEDQVQEAYDLPQRPNEAQIFYGNMNKVMLSLFGTMEMSDSGESDHMESVRPSQQLTSESDSNASLDVLPVKGPPLSPSEPVLKRTEMNIENTWSIKPEQLVLTAPTINSVADTRHVQILNRSNRELSFELSWPAHCLTITPQHGVIEPQSHLQILISPNPSLASKSSMLPWSGQIYVQCDNQQKSIKVQIRQDLAMDVSATSCAMDRSLRPLPPQAETPVVPGQKPQSSSTQPQVEIKNRTLVFPPTASGESSECSLELENHGEEVRWYLSSFAPPYVKGVDSSGDVYRATYSAFRCEKVSGTLGIQERMQVPFTFLPRDRGDYAQFWDLECHPTARPQHKSRVRFQLCGTVSLITADVQENCSLVKTEATVKNRKRLDSKRGVYAPQSLYTFPATRVGATSTLKVNFRNNSSDSYKLVWFMSVFDPFPLCFPRSQHYINLPVQFVPATAGQFSGTLLVQTDTDAKLAIELSGEALL
uniref:Centrosomal protein 192 n=1 Tax=Cyprinus carpio TaxID=7962 RepID=A0A8C2JQY5_CYPCA